MSTYNNVLYPTMNNRDRWLVLVDAIPDIGRLGDAFFQISLRRRTVNGFTTNDPLFVVNFLATLSQRLAQIGNRVSLGAITGARGGVVVLDRRGSGSVVNSKDLEYWATQAYMEKMALKALDGWTFEQRRASAELARRSAEAALHRISSMYRPRKALMLGEEPMQTLARHPDIGRWFLGTPQGAETQMYRTRNYYAQTAYQNDLSVPMVLRQNVWRAEEKIRQSLARVMPIFERLKMAQIAEQSPIGSTTGGALLGASYRLSQSIAKMISDTYQIDNIIDKTLRDRVNYMVPAELDAAMLESLQEIIGESWERVNVAQAPFQKTNAPYTMWRKLRLNAARFLPQGRPAPTGGGNEPVPMH